ncbi:N-acetylmuramoyl-L-alanine amidase [Sansalvadorimonas sp. 2012CJ34-2]|uniref:N-acetylmuramoyl-L-alanine amidase n=1 Tax=Parendozoicomonas callyspongiae TaxID=2942213 RepID=A0ABT0PFX4_9GAMM|nr:N-acetylmuramoyl-L-alanine amidase [Sansalvadorimonas sp. 2012CJ34-2]MCL6270269.1 N-acetylmuramoyl-L-alanine amidase [Sansalvadorimonas sp. 2012CJ34-2]
MGKRNETNTIVVHCSATKPDQSVTFDTIKRWHLMERAFMDIGYHWVIERDGSVKQGRPIDDWGAHVKGHNHESVGICLVGGTDQDGNAEDNFTSIQKRMLKFLVGGCLQLWPEAVVKGHYHFNRDKDCPSFDIEQWLVEAGFVDGEAA